jgi:glycosyltransferase involved in cell wall biosynthesis
MTGNNVDNDRKNIPRTLELFARTFEGNYNVGLVVKTNFGSNSKLDQKHTKNIFLDMIEKIGGNGPSFYLLHGPMTNSEMFGLYTHPSIKCMLSLTRGEGFGLPLLEAAACGLPIIATQWSAHTEFLDKGFWLPIQSDLENVHPTRVDDYFIKEAKWAAPNMEVASARLKKFYAKSETPKVLAKDLQKEIRQQYSEKAIQKIYNEKLGDQLK